MKILAIDTASTVCSVAILENDQLLGHKTIDDEKTHSQKLMPLVQDLFSELNLNVSDIDLFGVDVGPGSFTGIRIGMSTVKAFCDIYHKPICGISSLETLAYQTNINSKNTIICSMIDAKHDNVYVGLFEYHDKFYSPICDFRFDTISNVISYCKTLKKTIIFVGNGSILFQDMIESELKENAKFITDMNQNKTNAFQVGLATYSHYQKDNFCFSEDLAPMYLKKSSAEEQIKEH